LVPLSASGSEGGQLPVISALTVKTLQLMNYVLSYAISVSIVTVSGDASCGFTYTIYNAEPTTCGMNAMQNVFTLWELLRDLSNPLQGLMTYVFSYAPNSPV
jgi:hypothetical protein